MVKDGQFPAALRFLGEQKRLLEAATIPWLVELRNRAQVIEEKVLQGPESALAQLGVWRAESLHRLGLDKYA